MVARGKEGGKGELVVWDSHVHTAVFKMDNQQGPTLCYSTGNSAQCYVAAWMGGKFGEGYMYIYG